MRLIKATVENFGSYSSASFEFDSQGLTLISGPTGSGKSTICDIIPWILYGRTAKNGPVSEVISWGAKQTSGILTLQVSGHIYSVTRLRGKENDLYFSENGESLIRGKDLIDTQKLLNHFLGMDVELYLSSSYYHEFAQTAQFFTTTAKNRKAITEQLVDLKLAKSLSEKTADYKKDLKQEIINLKQEIRVADIRQGFLQDKMEEDKQESAEWKAKHQEQLTELAKLHETFESDKNEVLDNLQRDYESRHINMARDIEILRTSIKPDSYFQAKKQDLEQLIAESHVACVECGAPRDHSKRMVLARDLNKIESQQQNNNYQRVSLSRAETDLTKLSQTYEKYFTIESTRKNTYLEEYEAKKLETNPYKGRVKATLQELADLALKKQGLVHDLETFQVEESDAELLNETISSFRQTLSLGMIDYLEQTTNSLLEAHFDAELRVKFDLEESDKLEVLIYKDGNQATYTQLSKGQRGLLKLCFSVAVMKACANHNSLQPNCLFFDEALDGLSEGLKLKAFNLFQSLSMSHESVFVIDHSDQLKLQFTNRYEVILKNGERHIEKM